MKNPNNDDKILNRLSTSYPMRISRKLFKSLRNRIYNNNFSIMNFFIINILFILINFILSFFLINIYISIFININFIICLSYLYFINKNIYKKYIKSNRIIELLGIDDDVDFEEQNRLLNQLLNSNNIDDENYEVYSKTIPKNLFGGDFIYQQKDIHEKYWFSIGDSSGHDINSHLFSMSIVIRLAYHINKKATPRDIHKWIDKSLEDTILENNLSISKYASLLILNSDSMGNFTHFGQHPNLIIFRGENGVCESVNTTGGFIGLTLPTETQVESNFQLNPGDILFAFTDGFFEQKNYEGKYYGTKLYDYIEHGNKEDLKSFAQNLYVEIKNFTGGDFKDDMSILIIRRK